MSIGYSFVTPTPDDPIERAERKIYLEEGYNAYARGDSRDSNPYFNPPAGWTRSWDPSSAWEEGWCDGAWDD